MYCPSCGEEVDEGNSFCPSCGNDLDGEGQPPVEESSGERISKRGYVWLSLLLAAGSVVIVPIVFGPLALFSGAQVYRRGDERSGIVLLAVAGICMIVGMMLGAQAAVA